MTLMSSAVFVTAKVHDIDNKSYQFCSVCNRRLFYTALDLHLFLLKVECGGGGVNGQDI